MKRTEEESGSARGGVGGGGVADRVWTAAEIQTRFSPMQRRRGPLMCEGDRVQEERWSLGTPSVGVRGFRLLADSSGHRAGAVHKTAMELVWTARRPS